MAQPDVSGILPSIREKGIHQTLLVRRKGDEYGVIAGRRRYFALLELAKERGKVRKALIRNRIEGGAAGTGVGPVDQCLAERDANAGWCPGCMQV